MTNRDDLIRRLLALPAQIAEAERRVFEAERARTNFEAHLQLVEDQMLLGGALDGKNAKTRAAQLRAGTRASREQAECAALMVAQAKIDLRELQAEHASL